MTGAVLVREVAGRTVFEGPGVEIQTTRQVWSRRFGIRHLTRRWLVTKCIVVGDFPVFYGYRMRADGTVYGNEIGIRDTNRARTIEEGRA